MNRIPVTRLLGCVSLVRELLVPPVSQCATRIREVIAHRTVLFVVLAGMLSVGGASVVSAQDEGFKATTTDIGAVIGVGGISGAGVGFGGRFEKGFKELPHLRDGVLGIGISADVYSFGQTFSNIAGYDYKIIPIAATVNYHVRLDNRKIDPFFGAGLGYERVSVSGPSCIFIGVNLCDNAYSSGIYFVGHAGIRYYWRSKVALYADVGSGAGSLHIGLTYKLTE